jgi:hypothetical protein
MGRSEGNLMKRVLVVLALLLVPGLALAASWFAVWGLYSAYSWRRKVCRDLSNATPMWVGCSSRSTLISIEVKP